MIEYTWWGMLGCLIGLHKWQVHPSHYKAKWCTRCNKERWPF